MYHLLVFGSSGQGERFKGDTGVRRPTTRETIFEGGRAIDMEMLILETKNKDGEVLRLQKDLDAEKYSILRGQYAGFQGRWTVKGTYDDLANAVGVYCEVLKGLVTV